MHGSAYSRGASVFGVLVLLGILSGVAIAFDASNDRTNQVAATIVAQATPTSTTPPSGTAQKSETSTNVTQKCTLGYDYVAFLEKEKMVVKATLDGVTATSNDAQGNKCNPPKDASGKAKSVTTPWGSRVCSDAEPSPWRCKLVMCVPKELTQKGDSVDCSKTYTREVALGGTFDEKAYKEHVAERAKYNMTQVSPQRASEIAKSSSGSLGSSFSQGLFGSFGGQERLDQIPAELDQRERELSQLQTSSDCVVSLAGAGVQDVSSCPTPGTNKTEAQLQKEIEDLKKQQALLQALGQNQTSLQPSASPTDANSDEVYCLGYTDFEQCEKDKQAGTQTPPGTPPPNSPPGTRTDTGFGGNRDPYDWLNDQTGYPDNRQELEIACRYGSQGACQQLARGGYGAYGGYPGQGSNRCGSQPNFGGGLGGIIGSVISLFTNTGGGSSNCTPDGVPLPQCTLTANPTNIQSPGQQVTLSWQSQDAFSATLSSQGSVGVNGSQVVQPQQTTTYTLSLQGYRNTQTGQVLSGQCSTQVVVGGTGTSTSGDPKAQIACSPQTADVGMSVAVSFSCLNSNTSSGSGFSTNNELSGSATPTVTAPTIGSDSVTYGLTCSREGKTDSAQCTVGVNKTALVLIANPSEVESGAEANIGWVTTGMQACTISSPDLSGFTSDNAGNTSVSGVARTPPLTSDARFVLTCTSRSGATKTAETRVEVE